VGEARVALSSPADLVTHLGRVAPTPIGAGVDEDGVVDALIESELDAINDRAAAAPAGPWWWSWQGHDHTSGDSFIGTGESASRGPDICVSTDDGPASTQTLDFIAAARQDVPRLVNEVRRLRNWLR
jgi:hypothetical protein